jgi:hypothetical protein
VKSLGKLSVGPFVAFPDRKLASNEYILWFQGLASPRHEFETLFAIREWRKPQQ